MELWIAAGFLALQCGLIGWDWMNRSRERKQIESLLQTKETETEEADLHLPGLLQCARLMMDLTLEEKSERHETARSRLKEQISALDLILFDESLSSAQTNAVYAYRLLIQSVLDLSATALKKKEGRLKRIVNSLLSDPETTAKTTSPVCAIALLLVRISTISEQEFERSAKTIRAMDPDQDILRDALFSLKQLFCSLRENRESAPLLLPVSAGSFS